MSFFDQNREALRAAHPRALEAVEAPDHGASERLTVEATPSGNPTAVWDGLHVHSRYDPAREARSLVEKELPADVSACVLLGLGLGYVGDAVRARYPDVPIVIVEPEPAFLRRAMQARDMRGLFGSPAVSFLVASPPEEVTALLESLPLSNLRVIRLRPVTGKNPAYFNGVEEIVRSFLLRRDININTLNRFGRLWVRNLLSNVRGFLDAPGVSLFSGLFSGVPSLLLAGGPSLDEVAPHLRELSRRLLIVAVDTPLRPCLSLGAKPDFVVMVDPQYWATRYLDWTRDYDGFIIVEPSTHPRAFRSPGRTRILSSSLFPLGQHFESLVEQKGKLGAGGSVSTSAWDFCRLAGATPVYTAGLDLGFPFFRTHCKGAFFEELWFALAGRLAPVEGRSFGYLREIGVFPLASNDGGVTLTDRRMILYKWWFEGQLASWPEGASLSLSGRAVRIRGMGQAALEEVLALPPRREEIEERLEQARGIARGYRPPPGSAERLSGALAGLARDLEDLEGLGRSGVSATGKLEEALRRKGNPRDAIERLDEIDQRIHAISSREIAGFLMQPLIHRIVGAAPRNAAPADVISASRAIYQEIVDSARFHSSVISRTVRSIG